MKRINLIVLSALIVANVGITNTMTRKELIDQRQARANNQCSTTPQDAPVKGQQQLTQQQLTQQQLIAQRQNRANNVVKAKATGYSTATIVGGLATAGLVAYEALAYYMGYPSAVGFAAGKAKDLYQGMTIENAKAAYAAVTWANAKNLFTNIVTLGGMYSFGKATAEKLATELPADTDKPGTPADTDKPGTPADTDKPGTPADTDKPGTPADTDKPGTPADTDKPGTPADTDKPGTPADTAGTPVAPVAPVTETK